MSNRSSRSSEKCKLPRLSLPNDFWDAYESDYSDSGAESLWEYEKDGYHPVHVGEVLDGRYNYLKIFNIKYILLQIKIFHDWFEYLQLILNFLKNDIIISKRYMINII